MSKTIVRIPMQHSSYGAMFVNQVVMRLREFQKKSVLIGMGEAGGWTWLLILCLRI
jgi:hypothetical protein